MSALDGLDAARRAGWAKAYAASKAHAETTASLLMLATLIELYGDHKVADVATHFLRAHSNPDTGLVDRDRWSDAWNTACARIVDECPQPFGTLGWPTGRGGACL